MRRAFGSLLAVAACLLLQWPVSAAGATDMSALLASLASQVAVFQSDFSRIVGTERCTQVLRDMSRRSRTRQLVSDVFFLGADEQGRAMTVRTVQRVDGRPVSTSASSVEQALALPEDRRLEKLRALADASARYNLGTLRRNFNDPTLALMFASAAFQSRFRFIHDGEEDVDGLLLQRVAFEETARPTVIRDGRTFSDIPAKGRLWLDEHGAVWRSELHLDKSDTIATIRVAYRRDVRLQVIVPATMDEDYRYRDRNSGLFMVISGHAVYADYRRFETSGRIVTP